MRSLWINVLFPLLLTGCNEGHEYSYTSETLKVTQLTPNTYIHTSFLDTDDYGKVACNGLFFIDHGEAIVLDTPVSNMVSDELIIIIEEKLNAKIKVLVPTHFHEDCLGGLDTFHRKNISSHAHQTTIDLAIANSTIVPQNGFACTKEFQIGKEMVMCYFFGEGHTQDNIVGYIPSEKTLFGGCLIKALHSGKGNLNDANIHEWSQTVINLKNSIPQIDHVVPGHGKRGDKSLLEYTINMFKEYAPK